MNAQSEGARIIVCSPPYQSGRYSPGLCLGRTWWSARVRGCDGAMVLQKEALEVCLLLLLVVGLEM